jgi:hypothetical protein
VVNIHRWPGDVRCNASRLILAEQLGCIFKIDIGKPVPVIVPNDEAGIVVFLDRPRRREAAGCHSGQIVTAFALR